MAGNTTAYISNRCFLPSFWKATGVTSGQTTGVAMNLIGITRDGMPLARKASIVSVGVMLSEAVTAGFIRLQATLNGADTAKTFDMTGPTKAIWEFDPGEIVLSKSDEIGFKWGSSGTLAPSGSIEVTCFVEVQWEV